MRFGVICYYKWLMSTSTMNIDEQNIYYHSNSYETNVALLEYSAFHYKDKSSNEENFLHSLFTIDK